MARIVVTCLCLCAALSVTDGKLNTRGDKPKSSKASPPAAIDTPGKGGARLPGRSRQCMVNGIGLFEGSKWSPDPCSVCQCQSGAVICHSILCLASNSQQTFAHKAKKLSLNLDKKEQTAKKKTIHWRQHGNKKLPTGSDTFEVNPRKENVALKAKPKAIPHAVSVKEIPAQRKKQEAVPKGEGTKVKAPLAKGHRGIGGPVLTVSVNTEKPQYVRRQPSFDDEDDDDDDDDHDEVFFRATERPFLRQVRRPVSRTIFQPVSRPTGRPLFKKATERSTVRFPPTKNFMESLPAGCLLSDYLIACGSTGLAHMPIITDPGVKALYLAENKISKLPSRAFAGLPNLEWLDLSKNKLDDSSLSPDLFWNLTKLKRLNLDGNNLTKVPPSLPPSLLELKINDNKISFLSPNSFKGLSKLLTLELEDNHFHHGNVPPLTFQPLKRLIYLRLDDNKFRGIPSGLPASLQELHLSDNHVEEVQEGILNKTVNLKVLNLSHNRLREDRLAPRAWIHLRKLESLDLSHNKLVHVPSFLPAGLRQLTLHHNQIERIPGYVFGHMQPGLDSLHLSHNRLRDDGIEGVSFLGLSNSLTELLLDHNQLSTIPRGLLQLKALQILRLNNNIIRYVPLNSLCDTWATEDSNLISVQLQYNLIDRHLIPPTAFSCIKTYHDVQLRPQNHEEHD